MGIDLNKDTISELTFDSISFSIRDYVAEIRKQDPKKCWPFGSLGDPNSNEFYNSYVNCSDHTPDNTEAPNLSNIEIINIEEDQPKITTDTIESVSVENTLVKDIDNGSSGLTSSKINNCQCLLENSVNEGPKSERSVAVNNNKPGTNRPIIKHQKFRLLCDIYKDPASEYRALRDETNPENVNKTFTAETDDDLNNDVTFDEIFGKRKGVEVVEVTDLKIKKKRRTVRVDQGKKSKRGFKETIRDDLEAGPGSHSRKKLRIDNKENAFQKQKLPSYQKLNRTEATDTPNEDFELEAVILLACHFNTEDSSANGKVVCEVETNAGYDSVQQKILKRSAPSGNKSIKKTSSTVTKIQVVSSDVPKKFANENVESVFCSVQLDDDHSKGTTAAGPVPNAQISETLVCSLNMNPADSSFLIDDNEFMRD